MSLRGRLPRVVIGPGWLITSVLLVMSLVAWVGPPADGLGSAEVRALATILVPVLVLPLLIAHEIAHHLVAQRAGVAPAELQLRLIGSPSRSHGSDVPPRTQAAIALAGPLWSLGIAALLLVGRQLLLASGPSVVTWMLGCVALANLVLGLVSLYPGRPLDGSEVVHAIARRVFRDPGRAAAFTTHVSVVAGWGVMVAGVLLALGADATAGLWLVLVGWLLVRTSRLGHGQERLMALVEGLTVRDALAPEVPVVSPGLTLDTLLDQATMGQGNGLFPVVSEGRLLGIIDTQQLRGLPRQRTLTERVRDRMRPIERVATVTLDQPLWDAVAVLERGPSALPVVDRDDRQRLLGLVSRTSVVRALRGRVPGTPADPTTPGDAGTPDR